MSYDPRLAARSYGAPEEEEDDSPKKGSVRAARKALQAAKVQGQLPDRSKIIGLPQRPNQNLGPVKSRNDGPALSPTPQWPLTNDADDVLDSRPGLLHPIEGRHLNDHRVQHQTNSQYNNRRRNIANRSIVMTPFHRCLDNRHVHSPRLPQHRRPHRWERYLTFPYLSYRCPQYNHCHAVYLVLDLLHPLEEGRHRTIHRCRMCHRLPKRQRRAQTQYDRTTDRSHLVWLYPQTKICTTKIPTYGLTTKKP